MSPSAHLRNSSHHGVLIDEPAPSRLCPAMLRRPLSTVLLLAPAASSISRSLSTCSTHSAHLLDIRPPIQSMARKARYSSSSLQAASMSTKLENRKWNAWCGTGVKDVVRVLTGDRRVRAYATTGGETGACLATKARTIARFAGVTAARRKTAASRDPATPECRCVGSAMLGARGTWQHRLALRRPRKDILRVKHS